MMKKILTLLLFITFLATQSKSTIKTLCFMKHPSYWKRFLALQPIFEKEGLQFVDENPDIIFTSYVNQEILDYNKPIIILERKASGFLWSSTRKAISNPQVKAIFKNRILKNKMLYNTPICAQSLHFNFINDSMQLFRPKVPIYIKPKYLKKIKCIVWSLDNSPFSKKAKQIKDIKINFTKERPIDVFFAGKVNYHGNSISKILYTEHRKQAIKKLKKIKNINILCFDSNRALSFENYIATIQKAKIVISPWGTGEWAHRDYEAMHCGAIMIKPDTGFLQAFPDIYQNHITYVPCLPNFSDLEEQIRKILANYDNYKPMRKYAKQLLVDSWDMEKLAYDFVQAVRDALQN